MKSNNFINIIQEGLRTAVGAAASAVETLQDSQKREQTLSELNEEWQKKSQEWAEKGQITEKEARKMIEDFFNQKNKNTSDNSYDSESSSSNNSNVYSSKSNIEDEIQDLTKTIISLREELEKS